MMILDPISLNRRRGALPSSLRDQNRPPA